MERFGDETQGRDQAVLAAGWVASKRPAASKRKRRRRPKSVLARTTTGHLAIGHAPLAASLLRRNWIDLSLLLYTDPRANKGLIEAFQSAGLDGATPVARNEWTTGLEDQLM